MSPVSETDIETGQTLYSSTSAYSVLEFIGEGCFGKVAKCLNLETRETVAIKILKKDSALLLDADKEVSTLKVISALGPDKTNMVKFFEQFEYMGQTCLAFEMLDRNLYDLLQDRNWEPLSLHAIRPIAKQLLLALDGLKSLGIVHTDIKPDNIMFVNTQDQPLRVKLIDFGEAIPASEAELGQEIQAGGYRAPEVSLGLPFNESIDVWGLGCILSFLFLAENLFQVNCDYQMMKSMVEVLGLPDEYQLRNGMYSRFFFKKEAADEGATWRLMTPDEFTAANGSEVQQRNSYIEQPSCLDALVNMYPEGDASEQKDRRVFVDLLKRLLHLDADERISPREALQHPFITMSHLESTDSSDYLRNSRIMMSCCQDTESHGRDQTSGLTGSDADGSNTGSSDGVTVHDTCEQASHEEPLTSWSTFADLSRLCNEGSASWLADEEVRDLSSGEATDAWISYGGVPADSFWHKQDSWSYEGGQTYVSLKEVAASVSWSANGAQMKDSPEQKAVPRSTEGAEGDSGTKKRLKQIRKFKKENCGELFLLLLPCRGMIPPSFLKSFH